jgi:hypothetical protein
MAARERQAELGGESRRRRCWLEVRLGARDVGAQRRSMSIGHRVEGGAAERMQGDGAVVDAIPVEPGEVGDIIVACQQVEGG